MPRFVLVRGIKKNFDIEKYFEGLKIQFDKKRRSKNFGVSYVETGEEEVNYLSLKGFVLFELHSLDYLSYRMVGEIQAEIL